MTTNAKPLEWSLPDPDPDALAERAYPLPPTGDEPDTCANCGGVPGDDYVVYHPTLDEGVLLCAACGRRLAAKLPPGEARDELVDDLITFAAN